MNCKIGGLAALLLGLSACPKTAPTPVVSTKPPKAVPNSSLPEVPVEIRPETIDPQAEHDPSAKSPLLGVMAAENARWMKTLKNFPQAPAYYLAYTIHDRQNYALEAESGALTADVNDSKRALDVEVRIGSPALDNRRQIRDPRLAQFTTAQQLGIVPKGSDPKAISHHLWLETDKRHREAALFMRLVQSQERLKSESKDPPDFSHEKVETYIQPIADLKWDHDKWEARVRACSQKARKGVATRASCRIDAEVNTVYFVNSEGSVIQKSWTTSRLAVNVGVKADDGMQLSRLEQEFAPSPDLLPSLERENEMVALVGKDLDDLHKAPIVDPWAGPVILEGRASAVFFHEVFGHRIEGHRQKNPQFGKTFTEKVGKSIMPEWLSVYDDPTLRKLNGVYLNGFFHYDDEGVRAQRASLVDKGILKGFVMSRSPIDGVSHSNGHGRAEAGLDPVSRQGNLVVESSRSVTKDELYKKLVEEVNRQGKEFGMVFTDISGGYTNTSTRQPQFFKVQPIMAYRVYADGRKELVRGVDISGGPLSVLENLQAAARPLETFNGMCGAESGWVPVSASAPSLLVKTLEVERGFEPSNIDPVLAPPSLRKQQPTIEEASR